MFRRLSSIAVVFAAVVMLIWYMRRGNDSLSTHAKKIDVSDAPATADLDVGQGSTSQYKLRSSKVSAPQPQPAVQALEDGDSVRLSTSSEWGRFRYLHTQFALEVELAVASMAGLQRVWGGDSTTPGVATALDRCRIHGARESSQDVSLTTYAEIRRSEVSVSGWGCEIASPTPDVAAECECFAEALRDEFVLSVDGNEEGELDYEGELRLRLR